MIFPIPVYKRSSLSASRVFPGSSGAGYFNSQLDKGEVGWSPWVWALGVRTETRTSPLLRRTWGSLSDPALLNAKCAEAGPQQNKVGAASNPCPCESGQGKDVSTADPSPGCPPAAMEAWGGENIQQQSGGGTIVMAAWSYTLGLPSLHAVWRP